MPAPPHQISCSNEQQNMSAEDVRLFYHNRNKTGILGQKPFSEDPQVTALWQKLSLLSFDTVSSVQESMARHVFTTLARTCFNLDEFAGYQAAAYSVRDQLIVNWNATQIFHTRKETKRVYYLSLEFLMGRSLTNAVLNMGLKNVYTGKRRHAS